MLTIICGILLLLVFWRDVDYNLETPITLILTAAIIFLMGLVDIGLISLLFF